ncbi:unnamed protein product, partial [Rodentolepis nana]|uniref:Mucin-19 n=1 Tax=Rodentolepis nana TaxID=102285 RepID=A0A0R3TM87_RODNA
LLSRGPKSVGIAQVIRSEPPSTHSQESGVGSSFEESRRRPSRPPIPPGGAPSRHPGLGCNPNAPYRGASAGPTSSGTTSTNMPSSTSSYPLHHSLYEVPPEARLQIRLQPPSPPSSQEESSWRLVQHPGVWTNQLNTPDGQHLQQQRGYYDGELIVPAMKTQQAMTSSSMTSSSTSTSTSSAGVVEAVKAAATVHSNSSSPSSPASSIVEDEMMMMMRGGMDKEDDSSSTMSYSVCGGGGNGGNRVSGKTGAVVTPIQKQSPPQQQRQRSLSGSGGPLHLLTNSDIHQLLNLTKMRETALVHRLLAEYRQTLLLQQSLHANSMSTPNLAASQELHTSATNNSSGGSNVFTNGNYSNTGMNTSGQQAEGGGCPQRTHTQRRNESYGPRGSCHDGLRGKHGSRCAHQNARGLHGSDSSDYVNACAFQCSHGCNCGATQMQTSIHSTTDNDSNATFRVLSEVDGARAGHFSTNYQHSHQQCGHTHNHHNNRKRHHHHEDSCTTNSDIMTSSNCSQQGSWGAFAKSNSFHHQPQRFGGGGGGKGGGGARLAHEMCKSATPDNFHRQPGQRGSPAKLEVSDFEPPLRGSSTDRRVGSDNSSGNGFSRSKTFMNSPQSQAGTPRVAFIHAFDRTCGSGHLHAGEYENLENDSPLLSSVNRKSITDISARSSSSDVSYEDYKFNQRLQRITRTPTTLCSDAYERHQHCPHHGRRTCPFNRLGPSSSTKRSTLPSNSCDGGGGHVQLCWEHMRALEQLGASKEVHIDTPMIQRRKEKKKARNVEKESCCSYCSIQQNRRYAEKARSFDPYKQKSALRHRCSASPVFSVEPAGTQCDLCRRQRRRRPEFERPRCGCDGSGEEDECSDEGDLGGFSSRAVSDSSLASSALPGTRDTTSIMVSSYEFECQQQQQAQHNSGPSFDNMSGGGNGSSSRKYKNKPPADERRGSSNRLQPHVNFCEDRQSTPIRNNGKLLQNPSTARKASLSPPSLDRLLQRPERPKTLLSSSASFQVEDHHHRHQPPDTPSKRFTNRPLGGASSRDGTPVRRTGGSVGYSRTSTPGRTMESQQSPVAKGIGGSGALFTASMTFTPSTNASTISPGPLNSSNSIGNNRIDHHQYQQHNQNEFQRCLPYKSISALSHGETEVNLS